MIPLNNVIKIELLPDERQFKNSFLVPDMDTIKKFKVLEVGDTVKNVVKGDIISVFYTNVYKASKDNTFTYERNVLFVNKKPTENKTHLEPIDSKLSSNLDMGKVISSYDNKIKEGDVIGYVKGSGAIVLPDKTEIISSNQIVFKS